MKFKILDQTQLLISMVLLGIMFILSQAVAPVVLAQEGEANDETNEIEEIFVTARYRSVSVQDIGGSIIAFGAEDMERLGIVDLASLVRATPSLNMQERGPNRNELSIRGVVNFLTTQDLLPSSRPVGVYLDDSPVNTPGGSCCVDRKALYLVKALQPVPFVILVEARTSVSLAATLNWIPYQSLMVVMRLASVRLSISPSVKINWVCVSVADVSSTQGSLTSLVAKKTTINTKRTCFEWSFWPNQAIIFPQD